MQGELLLTDNAPFSQSHEVLFSKAFKQELGKHQRSI